jgi:co-chaperonin GroES (HSP10)
MAFRPLHGRVVVKRLEGEDKTKGGIIIPDTVKEKPQDGKIIAVGRLCLRSIAAGASAYRPSARSERHFL